MEELYGELEQARHEMLTAHLASCATCAANFASLAGTRKAVAEAGVALSLTDEDEAARYAEQIFARAAAQPVRADATPAKVVEVSQSNVVALPTRRQDSATLSRLGRWAMRPQTAMAAVFLLMIGSSALLLKGHSRRSAASVTVTQAGAPVAASAEAEPLARNDEPTDPAAHGVGRGGAPAPLALAPPPAAAVPNQASAAQASPAADNYRYERERDDLKDSRLSNAGPLGGATQAGAPGGAPAGKSAEAVEEQADKNKKEDGNGGGFDAAMALYRARAFDEATGRFDQLARRGDTQAALWAARSVRDGRGCASALTRFDQLAQTAFGTPAGHDATLEGGICYRNVGSLEAANQRFGRLLMVPSHAARAQAEIDQVHRIAERRAEEQKRAADSAGAAGGAAAPAKPAARSAPAAPAAAASR